MEEKISIKLGELIDRFKFEIVSGPQGFSDKEIVSKEIIRPGLQLTGFFDHFDADRIQIMGRVELKYLEKLSPEQRYESLEAYFQKNISVLLITRNLYVFDEIIELSKKYNTPILRTQLRTSQLVSDLINYLNLRLAKSITRHGVLVEVYGEGVLFMGESGVGKSETAIELVKRGHILVADDAVELKKISHNEIMGSSPELIRHFIEIRGIGIINVKNLFGVGSVKNSARIDLIINLESWDDNKYYDRLGMVNEYTQILDVNIPSHTIPVKPGRNLAIIIETAAMNNRQKRMGYNAAAELNERILEKNALV